MSSSLELFDRTGEPGELAPGSLNVLFVNGIFPEYSQTFVVDQIRDVMGACGNRVSIFSRRIVGAVDNDMVEFAEIIASRPISVRVMYNLCKRIALSPATMARAIYLVATGKIDSHCFRLIGQIGRQPNVCVTNFGHNAHIGCQLKKFFFPEMVHIVVFHGFDVSVHVAGSGWSTYKALRDEIDIALAVNTRWADVLVRLGQLKDVRVHYLGTDVDCDVRRRPSEADEPFRILFVGRVVEKKGLMDLVEAVDHLRNKGVAVLLTCIGDGPLLSGIVEWINARGLLRCFAFHGAQPRDKVYEFMRSSDLLVAPSRTASNGDCEGLPIVILEALARELPVVATAHSGIPEVIRHNVTGLLVPEGRADILAKAIEWAKNNRDDMARYAAAGRRLVVLYHNRRIQGDKFVKIITEKVGQDKPRVEH
ncbi:MAG: glycosyltransferase [Pseudomonadota bacterium]